MPPASPDPPPSTISLNQEASGGISRGAALPVFAERTIEDRREDARRGIAYAIVGCFVITIVGSFAAFWWRGDNKVDDVVKLIQAVIAPVVAIVGAVTGFYFSSNLSNTANKDRNAGPGA
jgi:cytochrome bd-type quinol oxidase subunit 2